ncbi:MAG: glycosyltransferase family 4 protein [Fimbriimonadaceae bacterium]
MAVSYAYAPDIGGIESVTRMLVDEWIALSHDVQIVTHAEGDSPGEPCPVHRRPALSQLESLHIWADVVWHNNISLTYARPAIRRWRRKPWVVTHATYVPPDAPIKVRLTKGIAFKLARNIAITRHIQSTFRGKSIVIPNPYDHRRFRVLDGVDRDRDAVFLGRLVSDKGADIAVEACAASKRAGRPFRLTIVGRGPEEEALRAQVEREGLGELVRFAGPMQGEALVAELNRHRVLLVPSRWAEPFGIVALEGAACGLVVVGPTHGGLPEAIGPCGPTIPIADVGAWADTTVELLGSEEARRPYLEAAPAHLERHTARRIAEAYLEVFAGK